MPLLNAEPPLFPLDLFDEKIDQAVVQDKTWWVLHTKPRQEKSLARELFRRQVPFYLPQVQRRWRLRGRMMSSHVPLFAGYLFLMADAKDRIAASPPIASSIRSRSRIRISSGATCAKSTS